MDADLVVIGFDGTEASERAVREAGRLLGRRPALVVVVWEPGRAFELSTFPAVGMDIPPAALDVRVATEVDRARYESAQQTARRGALVAREAGFDAEAVAVADELTVADTLVRLARERQAAAVVIGAPRHGALSELLLGSTSGGVLKHASCPVVVVPGAG